MADRKIARTRKKTVSQEELRLQQDLARKANWKRWGPYLSERQWGTVREDYSATARHGTPSRTITRAAALIAGAKTASAVSATATNIFASRSRCGTAKMRS